MCPSGARGSRFHTAAGSSQAPVLKTVGLFIMMPSANRLGADHSGDALSGSSVVIAHTPARPSQKW